MSFHALRVAQLQREAEWDKDAPTGASFRGNELGGETGEALEAALNLIAFGAASGRVQNLLKKLDRAKFGMVGSVAAVDDLADELSDVIICVDRVASRFKIDLWPAVVHKFNKTSVKNGLKTMLDVHALPPSTKITNGEIANACRLDLSDDIPL